MNLLKAINNKFSMILIVAAILALPVFVSAQVETAAATSGSRHLGGVNVVMGDGSVKFIRGSINVRAWKIYLPNSPLEFDNVDARDPNAENKARALFDAAYRLRSKIIFTLEEGAPDVSGSVPVVNFFISDGGDQKILAIELKDCLITSYDIGGSAAAVPSESYSLNFAQIKFEYKPQK